MAENTVLINGHSDADKMYGRFSKNVKIHVTECYLLEKALNSNWKWSHQTQHNVRNKKNFTEEIEVLRVLRNIDVCRTLMPPSPTYIE